jgi:hypothetical protein
MFVIVGKEPWRTVTVIDYLIARALQPLDQPRRSQRRGRFLAPRQKRGRTGWRANQGNLLRLTDDFDRQVLLLVLCVPAYRAGSIVNCAGQRPAAAS